MDSNLTILDELVAMGFPQDLATQAVTSSGCVTLEEMINWILVASNQEQGVLSERLKMVLVVRMDLGMSPGKVASQCVHAALGAVRIVESLSPHAVVSWRNEGEPVVCLRCVNFEELQQLKSHAERENVSNFLVYDAGRTEIAPGSGTVLAIGPAYESRINLITGHLKLY